MRSLMMYAVFIAVSITTQFINRDGQCIWMERRRSSTDRYIRKFFMVGAIHTLQLLPTLRQRRERITVNQKVNFISVFGQSRKMARMHRGQFWCPPRTMPDNRATTTSGATAVNQKRMKKRKTNKNNYDAAAASFTFPYTHINRHKSDYFKCFHN